MNIEALNIIFENGEVITLNKEECSNFYISNVKDNGEEIPYEPTIIKNKLYANLCLIKLNKEILEPYKVKRLKNKKDIVEVQVIFGNKCARFDIASNANPFMTEYNNDLEYIYEDDNNLGLLMSEYNIKYRNNLFV